jgi:hypothetical protein
MACCGLARSMGASRARALFRWRFFVLQALAVRLARKLLGQALAALTPSLGGHNYRPETTDEIHGW